MSNPTDASNEPTPLSRREAREAALRAEAASASVPTPPQPVPVAPVPVPAAEPVVARHADEETITAPVAAARAESSVPELSVVPENPDAAPGVRRRQSDNADSEHELTDMADLFAAAPAHVEDNAQKRRKRRRGCLIWLIILALIAGGITAGGIYVNNTYGEQIREKLGMGEPKDYDSSQTPGEKVTVVIVSGDTGESISQTLFEAGVTKTPVALSQYLRSSGLNPSFYPGTFSIQSKLPAKTALEQLEEPANKLENSALIKEGATEAQIYGILAEALKVQPADVEAAAKDPSAYGVSATTLEGWLFPATYIFEPGTTPAQAIQTLVDRTRQSLAAAGVPAGRENEILTIASIIQREGKAHDFDKVSRVIQNRLGPNNDQTNGYLQMDSTAQYGVGEMHAGVVYSTDEALKDDNPWNTYMHTGLPIGPIASPGDAAIDAAMHPADGPWFYFVTVNLDTGETIFTNTLSEHMKAKEKLDQWCIDNPDGGCV